jgi:hypothetical protein
MGFDIAIQCRSGDTERFADFIDGVGFVVVERL